MVALQFRTGGSRPSGSAAPSRRNIHSFILLNIIANKSYDKMLKFDKTLQNKALDIYNGFI